MNKVRQRSPQLGFRIDLPFSAFLCIPAVQDRRDFLEIVYTLCSACVQLLVQRPSECEFGFQLARVICFIDNKSIRQLAVQRGSLLSTRSACASVEFLLLLLLHQSDDSQADHDPLDVLPGEL